MSAMKCLSFCLAVLPIACFVLPMPAVAFGTETAPSAHLDGGGQSAQPSDRASLTQPNENGAGSSAPVLGLPPLDGKTDKSPSASTIHGSTFDPDETRFVFGPFNHFGYGGANQ
ncbi:MAG TPA: hypothetical protein VEJ16_15185 [Alphaproteobacteria bacterium]|nr:hypothetical protein [Alphaproteobacteria bacterium]